MFTELHCSALHYQRQLSGASFRAAVTASQGTPCYLVAMPKIAFPQPSNGRSGLICFAAIAIFCLPAFGQNPAPTTTQAREAPFDSAMFSDLSAFMSLAGRSNGLSQVCGHAWHLKVTFKVFDDQGNAKDQGTYEEFWAGKTMFKRAYSSTAFTQTDYGTQKGVMRTGIQDPPPPLIQDLFDAYIDPLPSAREIGLAAFTAEQREANGDKLLCISMRLKSASPTVQGQIIETSCFDAAPNLRTTFYRQDSTLITGSNQVHSMGVSLPGDLKVETNGKIALSAHLESIEQTDTPDAALFSPPPDATAIGNQENPEAGCEPKRGPTPIKIVRPDYPTMAENFRENGTVSLSLTIGKDGHVSNVKVLGGNTLFQQAAVDAAKQWIYKPILVNGEPAEVHATVSIVFKYDNRQVEFLF
jgi:TonB family protein